MTTRLPDFVIVGAQKSASTYIHLALREHPGVCMPAEEIRFFEDPEYAEGDAGTLSRLFAECTEQQLRGIKRPDYLARPEVPMRIRALVPDARIIAVLRDPVSRLMSAYHYYIKMGLLPAVPMELGLQRVLDGDDLGSPRARELLEYGRYATHLERYLALFPEQQIRVVLQDDVVRDKDSVLSSILAFLDLPPFRVPPVVKRDNAGLYSLPRLKFLSLRNRFLYDYAPVTRKLIPRKSAAGYLMAGAITLLDRVVLGTFLPNTRPTLPPQLAERLADYYRPEIERLEKLLARPLPGWR